MMKKIIVISFFICAPIIKIGAQINLVRNGSFEKYSNCPNNYGEVYYSYYWESIDSNWTIDSLSSNSYCEPAYINNCTTNINLTEPDNSTFYHYPRTGNAMMEVVMFYVTPSFGTDINERDYLQQKLGAPLIAGQSYCVTFYVALEQSASYAINHIGAYFDNGTIDTALNSCGIPHMEFTPPQILDTAIISDTLNWTKIQGSFIANGTEQFITIGNLYDSANTAYIPFVGSNYKSAYLVDDVSVIPSNATANAGPNVGIGQGDSTWIGVDSNGDGMPCIWYIKTNTGALVGPIDSGGYIKVKPDTTTKYEVQMDLCGTVTTDTVTVYVWPLGVSAVRNLEGVKVYPNPTADFVNVSGLLGTVNYHLTSVVGSVVKEGVIGKNANTIDVGDLASGVYLLEMSNETGEKNVFKVVKQ